MIVQTLVKQGEMLFFLLHLFDNFSPVPEDIKWGGTGHKSGKCLDIDIELKEKAIQEIYIPSCMDQTSVHRKTI